MPSTVILVIVVGAAVAVILVFLAMVVHHNAKQERRRVVQEVQRGLTQRRLKLQWIEPMGMNPKAGVLGLSTALLGLPGALGALIGLSGTPVGRRYKVIFRDAEGGEHRAVASVTYGFGGQDPRIAWEPRLDKVLSASAADEAASALEKLATTEERDEQAGGMGRPAGDGHG